MVNCFQPSIEFVQPQSGVGVSLMATVFGYPLFFEPDSQTTKTVGYAVSAHDFS
jgi:hypothetical protein